VDNAPEILELDELYWYIGKKAKTETKENVYLMLMVGRKDRKIYGFDVAYDKSPKRIQDMVDGAIEAEKYCTDGYLGYIDIAYPGKHIRNVRDKSETFTVEGVNSDLRHYIPTLARRSKCFARKLETLYTVVEVFIEAYNRFSEEKQKYRQFNEAREVPFAIIDYL